MASPPSPMTLHLRYRIWIAEMNSDIDLLRIYNDYLQELKVLQNALKLKPEIERFETAFSSLRNELDTLKNEMHLLKMKLATFIREKKKLDSSDYKTDNHKLLKKKYISLSKKFGAIKADLKKLVKKAARSKE
jgi:predicted RNase H-like nuclease (RuvC/YqgF family)